MGMLSELEVYTINELCDRLGRKESFIRKHFVHGSCPSARIGDMILFHGRDIATWIQQEKSDDQQKEVSG